MKKRLPPIFEKMRFKLGKEHAPSTVIEVSNLSFEISEMNNAIDIKNKKFSNCKFGDYKLRQITGKNFYEKITYNTKNFSFGYRLWVEGAFLIQQNNVNGRIVNYETAKENNNPLELYMPFAENILFLNNNDGSLALQFIERFMPNITYDIYSKTNLNVSNKDVGLEDFIVIDYNNKTMFLGPKRSFEHCQNHVKPHERKEVMQFSIAQHLLPLFQFMKACQKQADPSVNTHDRNKASGFVRVGDTIRYDYLEDLASQSGNDALRGYVRPEVSSGIRKREHQVRGHVRIRNGRTIWVRSHKRGDAELGRVTRVIH